MRTPVREGRYNEVYADPSGGVVSVNVVLPATHNEWSKLGRIKATLPEYTTKVE